MIYVYTFRDNGFMERETMGDRLKWARERAGWPSARQAALKKLHMSASSYAAHENGQNDFGPEDAERYGKAFGINPSWLLLGEGVPGRPRVTTIAGKVGAGSKVFPADPTQEEIEIAPSAPLTATAVVVDGDSMYPRYFHGEKLFYVKDGSQPSEHYGRECVVQLRDGGMLVKILRPGSKKKLFNLESWNAPMMVDQPVEWAAPVRWTARG